MNVIINPGSRVERGTRRQALENAKAWRDRMRAEGINGVALRFKPLREEDGRWVFAFVHMVSRVECELTIDGLTDAQKAEMMFRPKVYWKGSSCSPPSIYDFVAEGYEVNIVKVGGAS